ncbi:hypothetical protein F66182_2782 [Fusarium sp. NRRL 66182]|nr:hypothetical protein F66182_2782 [Fusarium sp. NRRL 66182]
MVQPLSPRSFHLSITNTFMGHDPIVKGFAQDPGDSDIMPLPELKASPSHAISSSSVGDDTSAYDSGASSSEKQSVCNKKCTKNNYTKNCCAGKGRRVRIVTCSEAETSGNAETTESGDEITDNSSAEGKKNNKTKKGKAAKTKSSTENESSVQTEEASTDADTSAKSSKVSNTNDPTWSLSEDCLLRSMKEAGESWNFICSSLHKDRHDARARWKILEGTSNPEPSTEAETGDATTTEETEGETNGETDKTDDQDDDDDDDEEEEEEEDEASSDAKASSKGKGKGKVKNNKNNNSSVNNRWHRGTRNNKVATENKKAKAFARAKTSEKSASSIQSGEEASAESSAESSSRFAYGDAEKQQEMKYLQDHIYKKLYPAEIHPKPDTYMGKRDCDLLATLDSK